MSLGWASRQLAKARAITENCSVSSGEWLQCAPHRLNRAPESWSYPNTAMTWPSSLLWQVEHNQWEVVTIKATAHCFQTHFHGVQQICTAANSTQAVPMLTLFFPVGMNHRLWPADLEMLNNELMYLGPLQQWSNMKAQHLPATATVLKPLRLPEERSRLSKLLSSTQWASSRGWLTS